MPTDKRRVQEFSCRHAAGDRRHQCLRHRHKPGRGFISTPRTSRTTAGDLDTPARSRAGPAAPPRCLLLYDDADLEVAVSPAQELRLTQHDILSIPRPGGQIERKDRSEGEVVVTSGLILLEIPDAPHRPGRQRRRHQRCASRSPRSRKHACWRATRTTPACFRQPAGGQRGGGAVDSAQETRRGRRHRPHLRILDVLIQAEDDEACPPTS